MSDEMKHSPLPWVALDKFTTGETAAIKSTSPLKGGGRVTVFPAICDIAHDADTNHANAQFIVTACNSYYANRAAIAELVEALRLTTITAAQLGATEMELDAALGIIAKHKAGE